MYAQDQMMVMKTINEEMTVLALNLLRRELEVHFTYPVKETRGQCLTATHSR